MPFTAKLSKAFYDRFGETIVKELVDLLNHINAESKTELRELNELNFGRFDARLEQRTAELRADLRVVEARLETKIDSARSDLEKRIATSVADLRTGLEHGLRDQTRFFFLAWSVLVASNIALWFR